jgi:hypothetical protein
MLFHPVHAVACVAEAGHDVSVIVEVRVDGRREDAYLRVSTRRLGDAFRRRQEADEADITSTVLFEPGNGGHGRMPVASLGSTATAKRSAMSSGSLQ